LHLKVDVMGKEYVAEGMLAAFAEHDLVGQRILLPRAAVARDLVPVELARRGALVDVVEAYRTVVPAGTFELEAKPDWIAFTSSSTVRNLVAMAGTDSIASVKVASIGPITSATARELGVEVTVEAAVFTVEGLVEAILRAGG
jgi:uroporphyrinogen III methyltransferase/synthase